MMRLRSYLAVLGAAAALSLAGCSPPAEEAANTPPAANSAPTASTNGPARTTPAGLEKVTLNVKGMH